MLKQLVLHKMGTSEYAKCRRTYKNTLKKKRLEYELQEFDKKIQANRRKRWLMLPRRKIPNIAKIELSDLEGYYGQLYSAAEHTMTTQKADAQKEEDNEWYNEYITNEEVEVSIRKMKRHKAVGPDAVAVEVLKENELLIPFVTRMLNATLDGATIATD